MNDAGLLLFVLLNIMNMVSLLVDVQLVKSKMKTIREMAYEYPWFAAIVIGLEILIPASLVIHLYVN